MAFSPIPSGNCSTGSTSYRSTDTGFANALCAYIYEGTGEADAGATGEGPRSTTGRHQEEAGRAEQVRWRIYLGDSDEELEAVEAKFRADQNS